ncbi:TPA: hypothetical protein ACH3X1_016782 [Trebouxia sp. C0004]
MTGSVCKAGAVTCSGHPQASHNSAKRCILGLGYENRSGGQLTLLHASTRSSTWRQLSITLTCRHCSVMLALLAQNNLLLWVRSRTDAQIQGLMAELSGAVTEQRWSSRVGSLLTATSQGLQPPSKASPTSDTWCPPRAMKWSELDCMLRLLVLCTLGELQNLIPALHLVAGT